jgi:hypothetical protein
LRKYAVVATILGVIGMTPNVIALGATGEPPSGTLTLDPVQLPNYVTDKDYFTGKISPSPETVMSTDRKSGLILQLGLLGTCTKYAAIDIQTYRPVTPVAGPDGSCPQQDIGFQQTGNSKSPIYAVDEADNLIFVYSGAQIQAFTEQPLKRVASWSMPSVSFADIAGITEAVDGLSWSAPEDQLIITIGTNTYPSSPTQPGLAVAAYDIKQGLTASFSQGGRPLVWTADLGQQCQAPLLAKFGSVAAVRSALAPYVYVPCQLPGDVWQDGSNSGHKVGEEAVVRVGLGPNTPSTSSPVGLPGNACAATAPECPSGVNAVAISPGTVKDFIFDAGADRAFLPAPFGGGTDVLVYDGRSNAFVDRSNVTKVGTSVTFALDSDSGRLYSFAPAPEGAHLIDGRRTPVSNQSMPFVTSTASEVLLAVIPPTAGHKYPRLPVPHFNAQGLPPFFDVYVDSVAVTKDPKPSDVDARTQTPAPGADPSISYGTTARGYGMHLDYVGGPGGTFDNGIGLDPFGGIPGLSGEQIPFGPGNRDLLSGNVADLTLRDGASTGGATALNRDEKTAADYSNPAKQSGQIWPYPLAECNSNGGHADQGWPGLYAGQDPDHPAQQSGTADQANAEVHCNGASVASTATATLSGWTAKGSAGFPTISVGPSGSRSVVTPPSPELGAVAETQSYAQGIRIDLTQGLSLSIGSVTASAKTSANGLAKGAHASYERTVNQVVLSQSGKPDTTICTAACSDSDLSQLNKLLSTVVLLRLPDPDHRYFDPNSGSGSPGGYQAAVEASPEESTGDQQFNAMSTEESALQPAMRIVLFSPQDGQAAPNRVIVDLAGVQNETHLGYSYTDRGTVDNPLTDASVAATDAGVAAYTTFDPGGPGGQRSSTVSGGLGGLVEKFLEGLQALRRSPREAMQMFSFLLLLFTPTLLMGRRRSWFAGLAGGSAV